MILALPHASANVAVSLSDVFCFILPGPLIKHASLQHLVAFGGALNSEVPISRWESIHDDSYLSALYGSFIAFSEDAGVFGISRMEARAMNPQMMLVLETSYSTLCVSAHRESFVNAAVGFFLGSGGTLMSGQGAGEAGQPSVYSGTSGALSVASGRLSFTLGLTGPCLTLDTACSSSLVAAHLGVSAIKLLECPDAVSTGVGMLTVDISNAFSAAGMLSAFGRCHTFDRHADGYCRSEGCGSF